MKRAGAGEGAARVRSESAKGDMRAVRAWNKSPVQLWPQRGREAAAGRTCIWRRWRGEEHRLRERGKESGNEEPVRGVGPRRGMWPVEVAVQARARAGLRTLPKVEVQDGHFVAERV